MLQITKVTKKFADTTAVNNLSLVVKPGEIVGLIGPNGSGKTTTIKMIAGLYEPTKGTIKINNFDVTRRPEEARCQIGYIPDEPAVYGKLTGEEFIHFVAQAYTIPEKEAQKRYQELKKHFPMPGQERGYFEDYSRGTRQKFMIIAALIHQPSLLIVDEPIVGLDPQSAQKTVELFSDFAKDKRHSILISTHSLHVAEELCDRFYFIKKGKIAASGTLQDLKEKTGYHNRKLEEIYHQLAS